MLDFKTFTTSSKNLHLEHLEDAIIDKGSSGGVEAIAFLNSIRDMLVGDSKSSVNITVKWDMHRLYLQVEIQKMVGSL